VTESGEEYRVTVTQSSGWWVSYDMEEMVATETHTRNGEIVQRSQYPLERRPEGWEACRVYWGSHGCDLARGHEGPCDCGCCECESHPDPDSGCVGKFPYYGPDTNFYGEDVDARGLPHLRADSG
jgi:hypothetical protein